MKNPKTPVAILVRVSTKKQETDRQINELQSVAAAKGWEVVEVLKEVISGRADESERHGLLRAEELASRGAIKKVLVHEISRLARTNSTAHKFVENLESHGVSLFWKAQGIETLLENGKRNPAAGMMLALLAEMARSEVEVLRERIQSGLEEAKRKGVRLGRPVGSKVPNDAVLKKHQDIVKNLKKGQSVRNTQKITGKGMSTVQRVKALMVSLDHLPSHG
jgi:DNA invertase Pin-like site-specific DNA recombinase